MEDFDGGHGTAVTAHKKLIEQLCIQLAERPEHHSTHSTGGGALASHDLYQITEAAQKALRQLRVLINHIAQMVIG